MSSRDDSSFGASTPGYDTPTAGGAPPTFAAFSPVTLSANTPSRSSRRSTILVHQKSPLLLATPPQITRALAYSHPFLLPLNSFVGLLTWSTGDAWQSFLLLCAFWAVVLYGDVVVRAAGPVVVGVGLIAGMYGRRYSPLSSSGWSEPAKDAPKNPEQTPSTNQTGKGPANENKAKHVRGNSELTSTKHQKTLDEIVETLKEFTGRCNVLLEPLLEMTDFLSTQRTPTSATTRPALTALFMRLLVITPFWVALTMPPWRIITTRRVLLVAGTLVLTWHSRAMRVSRTILWRSMTIRRAASAITGLRFDKPVKTEKGRSTEKRPVSELSKQLRKSSQLQVNHRRGGSDKSAGVKFTFIIYENQRRWVGLGWTTSLFAYERSAWSDEHANPVPPKDEFGLPEVEDGSQMQWRWARDSHWKIDGVPDDVEPENYDGEEGKNGWIYYDNKWQNGRRGLDGWGRWTRRRKWYRDAELVEVDQTTQTDGAKDDVSTPPPTYTPNHEKMAPPASRSEPALPNVDELIADDASSTRKSNDGETASIYSTSSRSFFQPGSLKRRTTDRSSMEKDRPRRTSEVRSDDASGLGIGIELELQKQGKEGGEWGIGDEARMSLE